MLNLPQLIGIHGPADGGKDTIGNYIIACYHDNFLRYAFAKPIKEACKIMFGFTHVQMEDRILKEQDDEFWGFSPRRAFQLLGTEYGRNLLRKDIWIKRAEMEVNNNLKFNRGTIITDVRFQNEADWVREQPNSMLIYIRVPNLIRDEKYNHSSEAGINLLGTDKLVINDKSLGINNLYNQVDKIFKELK